MKAAMAAVEAAAAAAAGSFANSHVYILILEGGMCMPFSFRVVSCAPLVSIG